MHEAAQHPRPRQTFEVRTRLASPLSHTLDLADTKAPPNEIVERNVPHDEVAPRFGRWQFDAAGGELLKRFGLHQGEIVAASARV